MDGRRVITLRGLYELLLDRLGPTHWWPADTRFEIAVGSILTQNTAWSNVELALGRLREVGALNPWAILDMDDAALGELIQPTGYWRTKTGYLKAFCVWFSRLLEDDTVPSDDVFPYLVANRSDAELRAELLALRGIGGETADDLLLYVFDRPAFIADRYARRLLETLGVTDLPKSYEGFRSRVQSHVERWSIAELKEFHGLIDEFGKAMRSAGDWAESFIADCRLTFERLEHVEHGFGPVWDEASRVLILGSMPSPKSREMAFYYGHPRNRFWKVMARIFDDDSCLPSARADCGESMTVADLAGRRRDFALRHHIALWDVLASCDIVGASDASIRNPIANDVAPIVRGSRIAHVFAAGAKAAQLYRRLCLPRLGEEGLGLTRLPMTQLPSTSPANASVGLPRLVEAYRAVRRYASPR